MSYLRLREIRSGETHELDLEFVRIGRDPDVELPVSGEGAQVVSAHHVELVFRNGQWSVEDLGSRNGTYLNGKRLEPGSPQPVDAGNVIGLGEGGPRFLVDAVRKRVLAQTLVEGPAAERKAGPSDATQRMDPLEAVPPPSRAAAPAPPPYRPPAPPPPAPPVRPSPPPVEPVRASVPPAAPPSRGPLPEPATAPPQPAAAAPRAEPPKPAPPKPAPPAGPSMHLIAREVRGGRRFEAHGGRVRIGRGDECELRPVAAGDTSVSRVHAEIVLKPDGSVVVRDARSRNGTIVNGKPLSGEHRLVAGDHIVLGEGGPDLEVEQVFGKQDDAAAGERTGPRRSFGGKGATLFVKDLLAETHKTSQSRLRWVVWTFVALLVVAAGVFYWIAERQGQKTEAALEEQRGQLAAQRAAADSQRLASAGEYDSLRAALAAASAAGSVPAAQIEELRAKVAAAEERASSLERAQSDLRQEIASAETARRQSQAEVARLQNALTRASAGSSGSAAFVDSIRREMAAAAQRLDSINAQMRAMRGVDLAGIARSNQAAVGLVTAFVQGQLYDASGFVITPSGYFVTNRHAVVVNGRRADSVQITMADQQFVTYADIVSLPQGDRPDVALLKIRNYAGPHIRSIDWAGTKARQGEPAALIGFPAGVGAALDQTRTVRTSMSGGLFSQVTAGEIRFDGFTVGGSSGSPVFNADGDVVAIHRAGLKEAAGLSFAVPIKEVIPLLPPEAKAALGLR